MIYERGRHGRATGIHARAKRLPRRLGDTLNKPLIVYWSSNSGGTRRVAEALNTDTVELADYDGTSPYVLMTPTYDQPRGGFTPKPVQQFLDKHAHLMVGVIGSGNRNFGDHYCQAAHDISKQFNVPVLWRIEIMGSQEDLAIVDSGMSEHWGRLLSMSGQSV